MFKTNSELNSSASPFLALIQFTAGNNRGTRFPSNVHPRRQIRFQCDRMLVAALKRSQIEFSMTQSLSLGAALGLDAGDWNPTLRADCYTLRPIQCKALQ